MHASAQDLPTTPTEDHALKSSIIDTWICGIEDRLISTGINENDPALADLTAKEIEAVLTRVSGIHSGLAAALWTYYQANNKGDFAAPRQPSAGYPENRPSAEPSKHRPVSKEP